MRYACTEGLTTEVVWWLISLKAGLMAEAAGRSFFATTDTTSFAKRTYDKVSNRTYLSMSISAHLYLVQLQQKRSDAQTDGRGTVQIQ